MDGRRPIRDEPEERDDGPVTQRLFPSISQLELRVDGVNVTF